MSTCGPDPLTSANLGFNDVRQWLADEAAGAAVREQLLNLQTFSDPDVLAKRFARQTELTQLMTISSSFQVYAYPDLDESLRLLALKGSTLFPEDLLGIANILEQTRVLQRSYQNCELETPSIWQQDFERYCPLPELEQDVQRVLGPDGQVQDSASPQLAALRRKLSRSSGAVRSRMNDLVKKYAAKGYLNDPRAGIKAGRLVLPILSSYKHQVKGVIQDMSHTGTTTFIEPFEIIELNNQIKTMELEEHQEIQRILKQLTAKLHGHLAGIQQANTLIRLLDEYVALVKFSKAFACSIPQLAATGTFKLITARNPRLALQRKVVPLNLEMTDETQALIITGPNAGGKTVALKTIGLLALMANCGIPIPAAEGSSIPLFDRIFTDIGDQQSLVNDLSTFSAHISAIITILEIATSRSLVLLDELGTGTDPAEGAALARAILEALLEKGVKTVVTTHLGDLKVFAHESLHIMNGAMEFDQQELRPTYRFLAGVPGSSYGFEISKRLGLSAKLLEAARQYTGLARHSLEDLLRSLEQERVSLSELKADNADLQRELRVKQKRMDSALQTVQQAERKADREAARKAGQIITDTRQTVEQVIRQIKESQAGKVAIKDAHGALDAVESQLEQVLEASEEPLQLTRLPLDEIKQGLMVTVLSSDQQGTVLEAPNHGKVLVETDGKRMRIPVEWLGTAPRQVAEPVKTTTVVKTVEPSGNTFSLDLRGYRAAAAIDALNHFVDQAVLRNLSLLQIIHGKGTGVIKKVVHELLEQHAAVKSIRLGGQDEGGAGVTFVELK